MEGAGYNGFPWTRFLNQVHERPFLYDTNLPAYKDSLLKDNSWVEIGEQFGLTGLQAKNKWRNARDRYIKIRVQMKRSKNIEYDENGFPVANTKWRCYSKLDSMLRNTKHCEQLQLGQLIRPKLEPEEYYYESADAPELVADAGTSQDGAETITIEPAPSVAFEGNHDTQERNAERNDRTSSPEARATTGRKRRRGRDEYDDEEACVAVDGRGPAEEALERKLTACLNQLAYINRRASAPPEPGNVGGDACHAHGLSIAARLRRLEESTLPEALHRISAVLLEYGV